MAAPSPFRRGPAALAAAAVLLAAVPAGARGEARLGAELDRSEVALGESVELTVVLESEIPPREIQLPRSSPELRVVSQRQDRQARIAFEGGNVRLFQSYTWTLALEPLRKGVIRIPGPVAVVGRDRHLAPALTLLVTDPAARAPEPDDEAPPGPAAGRSLSWRGWERDLALRVRLDRKEAFVGEQVTATVELVSPVELLRQALRMPASDGFWSEDLKAEPGYRVGLVAGVPTRIYTLGKLALFPSRSGTLTVEPAEAELQVQIARRDPFGLTGEVRTARRSSRPVTLRVKPLPPRPPAGFEPGNVGEWSLSVELPASRPAAGQPFPVRLVARGTGNLRALVLPPLPAAPGLRAFDPSVADEVVPRGDRFGGTRAVETLVALEREGSLVLPSADWPYFDPRTGRFERALLPEIRLEAGPALPAPLPSASAAPLAEALRPLRAEGSLVPRRGPAWRGAPFLLAMAAPPLLFLALALGLRWRERRALGEGDRRRRRAAAAARRRLSAARRRMEAGDAPGFHAEVGKALLGYAGDRLGRPVIGLTREALAAELARAGARGAAAGLLSRALEACDAGSFGGASRLPELLAQAEEAVTRLEEVEWRAPGGAS